MSMQELRSLDEAKALSSQERIAIINDRRRRVIAWREVEKRHKSGGPAPTEEELRLKCSQEELRDAVRLIQVDRGSRASSTGKTKVVEAASLDDF